MLQRLASAVARRRLRIFPAQGEGGLRGDAVLLPPVTDGLGDAHAHRALLRYRTLFAATAYRLGLVAPAEAVPPLAWAHTVLVAPLVTRALVEDLPGAGEAWYALRPLLLAQWRRSPWPRGASRALGVAVEHALGGAVADALAALSEPERRDAERVLAAHGDDAETLALREDLARALPSVAQARSGAVLAAWGLVQAGALAAASTPPGEASAEATPRGGSERRAPPREQLRVRQLDGAPEDENPLVHSFEKVHTVEAYKGGRKRADGDDDLAEHGDALDELDLDEVTRGGPPARSVYRADVLELEGVGALADAGPGEGVPYDEWDVAAHAYRRGYCTLREEPPPRAATPEQTAAQLASARGEHRHVRRGLEREFARLFDPPRWRPRSADGPEVDLDALVDRHGALRAGTTGPERLYVAHRRAPPSLAVLFLLDRSLSADGWIAGRRVLDVGRAALVALGDVLEPWAAHTALWAFHSHTRRDCRVTVLKPFATPWPVAHGRLAALEAEGYTRIGPALRHATTAISRMPVRRKLVFLLSDGKPTDYDRYEGRYGVADVARAVGEARDVGVTVFGLVFDDRRRSHQVDLFGRRGFQVVQRPIDLVTAAALVCAETVA